MVILTQDTNNKDFINVKKRAEEIQPFFFHLSANVYLYFWNMKYASLTLEKAVNMFSSLPGIGKKTALRLVLHMINKDMDYADSFACAMLDLKRILKTCETCNNLSDNSICDICKDSSRRSQVICLVENVRDVMAIEDTQQYSGMYHVLGGLISPIDGISPEDLDIDKFIERVKTNGVEEVIMALSPTIEGETTIYYISKKLKDTGVRVSLIARGVAFGGELEYADEVTLGRSIMSRLPYNLDE